MASMAAYDTMLMSNTTLNISWTTTEPSTSTQNMALEITYDIAKWINGFIILLGLVTNSLILIILSRRRIGSQTTRIILMFLSVTDLLVMLIEFFIHYVPYYWKWFPVFYTDIGCGVAFLVQVSVITTSSWYLVLMTLERFTVVWFPMKAKIICTQKKILIACILIPILSLAGYYYNLLDNGIVVEGNTGYKACAPKSSEDGATAMELKTKIQIWIVTYFFVPACLIVVLNLFIVAKLAQARKQQKSIRSKSIKRTVSRKISRSSSRASTSGASGIKKATTLVIVASITFVILMIPRGVSTTISLDANWQYSNTAEEILDHVAYLLQYLNHAINFFLYVLANNSFRRELRLLFSCTKTRRAYVHNPMRGDDSECTQMTRKARLRSDSIDAAKHSQDTCVSLLHNNNGTHHFDEKPKAGS